MRNRIQLFVHTTIAPRLRAALMALTAFTETLRGALRELGGRIRRAPRRRVVAAGILTGTALAAAPVSAFAATGGGDTPPSPATSVTQTVSPGKPVPTKPGAPADSKPIAPPAGSTPEQVANAKAIADVAAERGLPPQATKVAIATALQESGLKNINYGDRDSLGLFQQRPSAGWGTPDQIMDPHYSAGKFLERLVQVPDWQKLPTTVAAQTVQASAFPDAYAKWESRASSLTKAVSKSTTKTVTVHSGHGHGHGKRH